MDNADFDAFKKRIKSEAGLFYGTSFAQKGREDAQLEASQWSYAYFLAFKERVDEKKGRELTNEDFEELYSIVKSRRFTKIMKISRVKAEHVSERVYRFVEEKDEDPVENLPSAQRAEYLKGWFQGIERMWNVTQKALSW